MNKIILLLIILLFLGCLKVPNNKTDNGVNQEELGYVEKTKTASNFVDAFNNNLNESKNKEAIEKIILTTEDNVKISALYFENNSKKSIILVHMYGKSKDDWIKFISKFLDKGFNILALDLRGHGKSILKNNSKINYKNFSNEEFGKMTLDLKAAKKYLKERSDEIFIVGASIGANATLKYSASDNEIKKIVLLSPGLSYRGINASDSLSHYKGKTLIVVSSEDKYSYDSVQTLTSQNKSAELILLENAGHGTNMLIYDKSIIDEIIIFFES